MDWCTICQAVSVLKQSLYEGKEEREEVEDVGEEEEEEEEVDGWVCLATYMLS